MEQDSMKNIGTTELLRELSTRLEQWYGEERSDIAFDDMFTHDHFSVLRLQHSVDKAYDAMMQTIMERYKRA